MEERKIHPIVQATNAAIVLGLVISACDAAVPPIKHDIDSENQPKPGEITGPLPTPAIGVIQVETTEPEATLTAVVTPERPDLSQGEGGAYTPEQIELIQEGMFSEQEERLDNWVTNYWGKAENRPFLPGSDELQYLYFFNKANPENAIVVLQALGEDYQGALFTVPFRDGEFLQTPPEVPEGIFDIPEGLGPLAISGGEDHTLANVEGELVRVNQEGQIAQRINTEGQWEDVQSDIVTQEEEIVLPEIVIRETYQFQSRDTIEKITEKFNITRKELFLANSSRWFRRQAMYGLEGDVFEIPELLSSEKLRLFYQKDFQSAPELPGYTKERDSEERFVFYENSETRIIDRVLDVETNEVFGYARARDGTVILTQMDVMEDYGLHYPAYFDDHDGTLDIGVEAWKKTHLGGGNPWGFDEDMNLEFELRYSNSKRDWGSENVINYPGAGIFYGLWGAYTKSGAFRLIVYVAPGSHDVRYFIPNTLFYTTPNRVPLEEKWLNIPVFEQGYPEYEILKVYYLPPGVGVTLENDPIQVIK